MLAPLDHETPRRREALARTLMVWLERRPSAPVLARELGLHPQSVRIRLRKLAVLFGSHLADPDDAFAALLALKATLPPAPPASKRR
ncbi:helix-turn-helix domain-containing protein [Aeromicrobium sp. UC242_57]|uniref:helix-turn-helix domain-containing protein n=1 Tax=Aeromicrobium sp. UC242_57 TaxID=3374624 RepID=UPI0037B6AD7D